MNVKLMYILNKKKIKKMLLLMYLKMIIKL